MNIFGQHQENTIEQFKKIESYAKRAALMADGHYGYVMPVGGVAAFDNAVSVVGVGYDIACGNCAIKLDVKLEDISKKKYTIDTLINNSPVIAQDVFLNKIASDIRRHISFGIGRSNFSDDAPVDDNLFQDDAWYCIPNVGGFRDTLRDKARKQLGTIGSGNHYIDVFVDSNGYIWIGNHFGSRGLGHTIAKNYMAIGQGGRWGDKEKEVETILNLDTIIGQEYWKLMEMAGKYAYIGREWVVRKVASIIGGNIIDMVHNHHNFAWKEVHPISVEPNVCVDMEVVVVRKGATPAFPYQRGFVGGSMGDDAVILQGTDSTKHSICGDILDVLLVQSEIKLNQILSLNSTVHGAGRVMSRTEAAGKWDRKKKMYKTRGKISRESMDDWLRERGVILKGAGLDEAPQAYRRLPDVLAAQRGTIEVLETLRPIIVCMADAGEIDPYKD